MSRLGKRLIDAAKSAQAIAKREANPEAYGIHVPAHLDVRAIRTKLKMSLHSRLASARSRRSQANSIFTFQTVDYFTARAARRRWPRC